MLLSVFNRDGDLWRPEHVKGGAGFTSMRRGRTWIGCSTGWGGLASASQRRAAWLPWVYLILSSVSVATAGLFRGWPRCISTCHGCEGWVGRAVDQARRHHCSLGHRHWHPKISHWLRTKRLGSDLWPPEHVKGGAGVTSMRRLRTWMFCWTRCEVA